MRINDLGQEERDLGVVGQCKHCSGPVKEIEYKPIASTEFKTKFFCLHEGKTIPKEKVETDKTLNE